MLKFQNLSVRRGHRELLHDVNAVFHPQQRVGVTGANGIGKSSLFAIITGDLQPDQGECELSASVVIAHVAQETPAVDMEALEYVKQGDKELAYLTQQLALAESRHDGHALARIHADLEAINAYSADSKAGKLLHGLGFSAIEQRMPVSHFSGGWRMRLNLAQALMCRSDLLLLDEPTNHLDLEAVIWLEDWLCDYRGLLLLISHDRDFLNRITTHIAHLENQNLSVYTGNYAAFEISRAEQLANRQAQYARQQREIEHMQHFIDRFRAKATKARQAQSRLRALERMTVIAPAHIDSPFDFHFAECSRVSNPLLRLEQAMAGYDQTVILQDINMMISNGDRIGLLGQNGAGKSTFVKLLSGSLPLMGGELLIAKGLQIGYFAQHQIEQLDLQASPLLHLQRLDKQATEQNLRSYLGGFAFTGDMAVSAIKNFSGGEKARLVLALIVYQRPNLLLLDEPTNHLDLEMRLALTTALQEFEGAIVLVSHDRHLLRTVADQLYLIADQQISEFDGDLDDYRQWVREKQKADDTNQTGLAASCSITSKKQLRQLAATRREQLKPMNNQLKKLEQNIEKYEQQKSELEQRLADSQLYHEDNKTELQDVLKKQGVIQQQLADAEEQWLMIHEELDALKLDNGD